MDLLSELTDFKDTNNQYTPFRREDDIDFKETFNGIPKSIMKFGKDPKLMDLIGDDDSELGKVEGDAVARGGGYAKNLRYSIYNPVQAKFILEYYTNPGDIVLDPFSGRGTRPIITSFLGRFYRGYDTCTKTIALNWKLLGEKLNNHNAVLFHGDGTELEFEVDNTIDAVFSCPPYYEIEQYSGEPGDISKVGREEFDEKIQNMFHKLFKLIKKSDYKTKEFHPVIFTVGSVRNGDLGLTDMDFQFQLAAKTAGFVLYDKLFTENNSPGAGFTFRRNYRCSFLTKVHETTLVFMKF
jgi:DNA modification methylase